MTLTHISRIVTGHLRTCIGAIVLGSLVCLLMCDCVCVVVFPWCRVRSGLESRLRLSLRAHAQLLAVNKTPATGTTTPSTTTTISLPQHTDTSADLNFEEVFRRFAGVGRVLTKRQFISALTTELHMYMPKAIASILWNK